MKRRTITAVRPATLLVTLRAEGFDQAERLVQTGAVYVRGRRSTQVTHALAVGDIVTVVLEESGHATTASVDTPHRLTVLHDGPLFLVVNKPAGLVAQPTPGRVGHSLLDLASRHLGEPAGLVHRLDRDTSGVTLFGKTPSATSAAAQAFREGSAKKVYLAVCAEGLPNEGLIDLPISKDPSRPGRQRASRQANGSPARTDYRVLARGQQRAVVALFPQTGRTHQLRAHLSAVGSPIVGDTLYGGQAGPRCLLHALRLSLLEETFVAPPPADVTAVLQTLAVDWQTACN